MPNYSFLENLARLKKLRSQLPDDYLKFKTNQHTLQVELDTCIKKFSGEGAQDRRDELIKDLIIILNNCNSKACPNSNVETNHDYLLLRYLLAGFIGSLNPQPEQMEELRKLRLERDQLPVTSLPELALIQGENIPLEQKIPDEIQNKELYQHLLNSVRLQHDAIGPNPFDTRKMVRFSGNKPIRNIDNMLQQCDLLSLPRNKKTKATKEKTVHLIWFGGVPAEYLRNIQGWKIHNPTFDVILYLDHPTAQEIQKGTHSEFIMWAKENKVHLIDVSRVIGYHFLYPYICHELTKPNYGAASDMARCIINSLYLGCYFDIPDGVCKKTLPQFTKNIYYRRTPIKGLPDRVNNDCLVVINNKGKTVLNRVMDKVLRNYQWGFTSVESRGAYVMQNDAFETSTRRRVDQTINKTGVRNHPVRGKYPSLEFNSLREAVDFDLAGTWIHVSDVDDSDEFKLAKKDYYENGCGKGKHEEKEEKRIVKDIKKDLLLSLQESITEIIEELRFEPRVIDFDKYSIFKNTDYILMAF